MTNAPGAWIGIEHALTGPNVTFSTACSSSAVAIGEAWLRIRGGASPVMLAGGAEAPLTLGTLKAWEALKTLASEDPDDPVGLVQAIRAQSQRARARRGRGRRRARGMAARASPRRADSRRARRLRARARTTRTSRGRRSEGQARALELALASAQLSRRTDRLHQCPWHRDARERRRRDSRDTAECSARTRTACP